MHYREQFARVLAEFGVHETHGVDLLRQIRLLSNAYEAMLGARSRTNWGVQLSGPRWRLLMHLYMVERMQEAPMSPTDLSRFLHVTKNTISSHLRSLENEHLIERELDIHDRRQFSIHLTPKGRALIETSLADNVAFLNHVLGDLTPAEIAQLSGLLTRLHGSLMRHGDLPDTYCIRDVRDEEVEADILPTAP